MADPSDQSGASEDQHKPNPPRDRRAFRNFHFAFFAGLLLSVIVWLGGGRYFFHSTNGNALPIAMYIVAGLKLAVCVALLFIPRFRTASAGLLASIPVGLLICIGSCALYINEQ